MRIHPAIARLRRNPAPQLRAQQALEAVRDRWLGSASLGGLLKELQDYGTGASLGDCSILAKALAEPACARGMLEGLFSPLTRALRDHPLGHIPLRHQYSQGLAVLQVAASGRAALSLVCYEARFGTQALAETVCFAGGERQELCLAGAADVRFFEILEEEAQHAVLDCESRRIAAGDRLAFGGPHHTKIVDRPHGSLVLLRLSRSDATPASAREYRIADGALVHRASGDRAESRDEMATAVLGAMRRIDAAPVLAGIARSVEASEHFRWQAVCQALALDTASGLAALTGIASSEGDTLAAPAYALRASLMERHPELAQWSMPCRAC